ncbi:hypothetical protein DFH06DRAFT_1489156, partial [Mycena polygramma]
MVRTQTKKKSAARPTDASAGVLPSSAPPSIPALLEKAQTLIVQCDYELAQRFVTRVLEQQPSNAEAKEMLGVVQLEMGRDRCCSGDVFCVVAPNPDAPSPPPPSAHLYLAQLCEDDPGARKRAIDLPRDDEAELKSNIVRALVGQVEIWMDPSYDLCFDPAAEKTCEDLLASALQTDPGNAEALQALASVRMSQQRQDEAKQ